MGAQGEAGHEGVGWEPLYLPVLRWRLIELEVRHRLAVLGLEPRWLVEAELGLGWAPGRCHGRMPVGHLQVEEDGGPTGTATTRST